VVVQPYLEADERLEQLSELLAQVGQVQFEMDALSHEEVISEPLQIEAEDALLPVEPVWPEEMPAPVVAEPSALVMTETAVELAPQAEVAPSTWENIDTGKEFQALFFEVAGVTFAVPLTELGGIHQLGEVSSLFGQPDWYRGIMTSREQKMNVVDTAQWVMPGQHLDIADYKYLIMLGESPWGLACHHLKGTELLYRDQVKWRHQEGKRP
jgi:purine-binding chemotaxis protein CheW